MKFLSLSRSIIVLSFLGACSSNSPVIVDQKGLNQAKYIQDKSECEQYASQVNTGGKIFSNATVGAVIGGAIGAIAGNSRTATIGAASGAILKGESGRSSGNNEKSSIVRNCLRQRGYRVLN